jgi:hypothetical protein
MMPNSPYYSTAGLGFEHLGQANATEHGQLPAAPAAPTMQVVESPASGPLRILFYVLDVASVGLSAFHGYRRHNGSIGAAVGWGLLGGLFPVITPAVAFAQGFGKPIVKKNMKKNFKKKYRARRSYRRSR